MNANKPYDPLDLNTLTQNRAQARRQKTVFSGPEPITSGRATPKSPQRKGTEPEKHELKDAFIGMLLGENTGRTDPVIEADNETEIKRPNHGTKATTHLQNSNETGQEHEKSKFHFEIHNDIAGVVAVNGVLTDGVCLVKLSFQEQVSLNARKLLSNILSAQLTKTLGKRVEVTID